MYQKNGYYYLITAEGGTEYGHAVTIARSKNITGPYELHPEHPFISARGYPEATLQKCGHGDLVETPEGEWLAVFLTGRPLSQHGRCTLGRETALELVEWRDDDWPYLVQGVDSPRLEVCLKGAAVKRKEPKMQKEDFDSEKLNIHFQSLRVPIEDSWLSLKERPGYLRLFGRESLSSFHYQSLIARRVQHFNIEASTCLEFEPKHFQRMAGLVVYYNTAHWFYLNVFGAANGESKYLQLISCDNFDMQDVLENPIDLGQIEKVYLKLKFNKADLQFYYGIEENNWIKAGDTQDGSILSDDYVRDGSNRYRPAFTGSFVGLCCQDLTGNKLPADFEWFQYEELD